ncbi:MAG: glucose-6-phosphate isomerase [Oscillospiraceae bacterium]|nr:glucose-6-phosphate isomerase [Oscillospiraceae bacterium]
MQQPITLDTRYIDGFVRAHEIAALQPQVDAAHTMLHQKTGPGHDFLGWLTLPRDYDKEECLRIKTVAKRIQADTDLFIVIGIGGSYLGARAVTEFLHSPNYNLLCKDTPRVVFAGNSISAQALNEILALCEGRRVSVNVISKSGTTTEPAIAFRALRDHLVKTVGAEETRRRIYVTTDRVKGTLKGLADREGYETFAVPDDIGGRFSVLTAVGLLPIAVAGCDIDGLMAGAAAAMESFDNPDIHFNDCYRYACARNILLRRGRAVELMVSYEPCWAMMSEWWKQLFGESEGKDGKGLYPASAIFSTDLHSLGQFIQDGSRILFETAVLIGDTGDTFIIGNDPEDIDGLNFLAGKPLSYVNNKAFEGTVLAHADGGTPSLVIRVPRRDAWHLGYLLYFFEKACAISGYILGVNPFDQPGVEDYKRNMFALLGKPGYEAERAALEKRLND